MLPGIAPNGIGWAATPTRVPPSAYCSAELRRPADGPATQLTRCAALQQRPELIHSTTRFHW